MNETIVVVLVVVLVVMALILLKCISALSKIDIALQKAKIDANAIMYITTVVDETKKLGESTHTLVNSNMGAQLLLTYSALHRVAILTNDADDIKSANIAQKLYLEHEGKQDQVDSISGLEEQISRMRAEDELPSSKL